MEKADQLRRFFVEKNEVLKSLTTISLTAMSPMKI